MAPPGLRNTFLLREQVRTNYCSLQLFDFATITVVLLLLLLLLLLLSLLLLLLLFLLLLLLLLLLPQPKNKICNPSFCSKESNKT